MRGFWLILSLLPGMAGADALVASRNIRSQTVLSATDLLLVTKELPGALQSIDQAVGLEARVNLYAGRPVHAADLGPAALIERNQVVTLHYRHGGLVIVADGRALDRAGLGETVKAMNLTSRNIISGTVSAPGQVVVSSQHQP